jgi:hypothetical protein
MLDKAKAWATFAELNPQDFARYEGGCGCPWCSSYRAAFDKWFEQEAARAAGGV